MRFCQSVTSILEKPHASSVQVSEGLYGEAVTILEHHGDYCLIRTCRDDYTGFVSPKALVDKTTGSSTHVVRKRFTPLFSKPDIKSAVVRVLPFGAELNLHTASDDFQQTVQGDYVYSAHCQAIDTVLSDDLVALASDIYLGSPYRWGGRSPGGLDCSGLVQMCAFAAGQMLPRDSGPQERFISNAVAETDRRRNDLVFWPGHVGLLVDPDNLLHATAHSLLTVVEPLSQVVDRAGPVSSIRRLPNQT